MDKMLFEDWIEGYLKAWTSNDPDDIAALFSEDADYYTLPFREPWARREAIIKGWIARDDQPGTWQFEYDWLAIEGDTGVLRASLSMANPPTAISGSSRSIRTAAAMSFVSGG